MFMGCPILWMSNLQAKISLSTLEVEYIRLYQSIRDLIGARKVIKEICKHIFDKPENIKLQKCSNNFKKLSLPIIYFGLRFYN